MSSLVSYDNVSFIKSNPISTDIISQKLPTCYTIRQQGISVITTAHSFIVLHATLHKGQMLSPQFKHRCKWRFAWTYNNALILIWAVKIHRNVDYCWSQREANQLSKWMMRRAEERTPPHTLPIIWWHAERLPAVNAQASYLCSGQWLTLGIPHASDNW